jgi:hypothetical protein
MLKNVRKGFNGDYGVKLTLNKLRTLCKLNWPAFGIRWLLKGLLDKIAVSEVYRVIVRNSDHPDQFPYIDCWQDAIFSQPVWLKACLEGSYRIMVAKIATTSKCREKPKEPVLAEEPKETPLLFVPLYPPLPLTPSSVPLPSTSDGEA